MKYPVKLFIKTTTYLFLLPFFIQASNTLNEVDELKSTCNLLITPAPTGESFQVICYSSSPTVADLDATGSQILWYDSAVGGVALPSTTVLMDCQVYFASQTIAGLESSERLAVTVVLIQSTITASQTVICPNESVQLSVPVNNISTDPFTVLDFSSSYNSNQSSSAFNGNALLTQAQAGNIVFNGVPFFIEPWSTTLNAWSARFATGSNPRSLVLPTSCRIITDFSLFANTYWGVSGTPALLNVEFYNNNQLVYVKDLVGDDDIRDFNNSASYTSTINNVNTVNYWTSANLNRRLDRINIPLPAPTAVDSIVINDFGNNSVQRVFVLAATLRNFQYVTSYLWSTGDTAPTITVNPSETTEYWVDITVNGQTCRELITITVSGTPPVFNQVSPICSGDSLSPLPLTSINGISGSWTPPISNTATTTYTFTPALNQCALSATMTIDVNTSVTPDFPTTLSLCSGDTPPSLNTTSPNGISGSWNPSVINATSSGSYVFTPNSGQCATTTTLTVSVSSSVIPDFPTTLSLCSGDTPPSLNTTSPNGISGSWNPSVINTTSSGSYVFTPNSGQCSMTTTLTVSVSSNVTPDFPTTLSLCSGDTPPSLNTTSPNGISGSWNPSVINATSSGSYVFTPNSGQCATTTTLTVSVSSSVIPDFPTTLSLCSGDTPPSLNTTSPNGISGSWNPSVINTTSSGSYVFTPNSGQCATTTTLTVSVSSSVTPDFPTTLSLCSGDTPPSLNTTSPNGISGSWNPSVINATSSGSYVFTPNSGQCASNVVLNVAIQVINGTILGESTLCQGATSVMSSGITGGVWSSQDESVLSIDQNGVVTGIQTGTAIIEYSIQNSCTFVLTKNITVIALPNPQINNQFICVDPQTNVVLAPVVLDSGLNSATHSFAWNLNGQPLSTTDSFHLASQEGVYTVTAMNLATGCVGSSTATVEVSSTAIATSVVSGDFQQNQTVTITLIGGSGDYVYILNDGHQQDSPVFTSIPSGENIIIIRDLNGCDDLILKVNSLQYPLFFTPNGDNINDTWNINGLENQSDSRLYIFDRYGKLIKNLRPSLGEGWDGTFLGFPLPASDYWFVLQYRDQEGNQKKFNSHFSLKR